MNENSARAKVLASAVKAVREIGGTADVKNGRLVVDGVDLHLFLDVREERNRSGGYFSKPSGRFRVTIGDYGSKRQFPPKKDGGHNYRRMAEELRREASIQSARNTRFSQQEKNNAVVEALRESLDDYHSSPVGITASQSAETPIVVSLRLSLSCTEEAARELYDRLKAAGVA